MAQGQILWPSPLATTKDTRSGPSGYLFNINDRPSLEPNPTLPKRKRNPHKKFCRKNLRWTYVHAFFDWGSILFCGLHSPWKPCDKNEESTLPYIKFTSATIACFQYKEAKLTFPTSSKPYIR